MSRELAWAALKEISNRNTEIRVLKSNRIMEYRYGSDYVFQT